MNRLHNRAHHTSRHTEAIRKTNLATTKGCTLEWPTTLEENTVTISKEDCCENFKDEETGKYVCNDWDNVLKIANCKAAKFKEALDAKDEFFYVETTYKTEAKDEWAKF